MLDFEDGCKIAQNMFSQHGYLDMLAKACDLPDKWIFFGQRFEDERADFGSCPIIVMKNDGKADWYSCNSPENIGEYMRAKPISLPT